MALLIRLPLEAPSGNKYHKKHWSTYSHDKAQWAVALRCALTPRAKAPDRLIRCVIRSYRGRLIDWQNLVAGTKPIPDLLQRLNYIRDDSHEWFRLDVRQFLAPKHLRCTTVQLIGGPY